MNQLSVIVIDDSEIDRYIIARQLKSAGIIKVKQLANAEEALDYLHSLCASDSQALPDLIILDVNMPRMNGFEFLESSRELFENGKLSQCSIVMYSGSEDQAEQKRALAFGAVKGFLLKGSTPEQVQELITTLV